MVFAVGGAVPGGLVVAEGDDEGGGGAYPFAGICPGDDVAGAVALDHEEQPGLAVASRGGDAGGVEHGAEDVAARNAVGVVGAA